MKYLICLTLSCFVISCGKHETYRPEIASIKQVEEVEPLSPPNQALVEIQSGNSQAFINIVTKADLALNQVHPNGNTYLIEAVLWQRVEIVEWLIAKDEIDLEAKDKTGLSALDHAKLVGNTNIIKLVGGGKLSQEQLDAELIAALYKKDAWAIKDSIAAGAQLNIFDEKGLTPLIIAIYLKDEMAIRLLLQTRKVDVNLADQRRRWSPLRWARLQKLSRAEQMLIRLGARE